MSTLRKRFVIAGLLLALVLAGLGWLIAVGLAAKAFAAFSDNMRLTAFLTISAASVLSFWVVKRRLRKNRTP